MTGDVVPPEHGDGGSPGPLSGVRVLDLSIIITGPYTSALLAAQGADVIKVERPGIGDLSRILGVSVNGTSALYTVCNSGKRSIAVDLSQPDGVEVVRQIAASADVVIQNFRPGVIEKLGLDYQTVRSVNPAVVYLSISAFGSEGPYSQRGGYDTVIQAYAGYAVNQADPEDDVPVPVLVRQSVVDKVTAVYGVQAITAALFARERGTGGQHLEVSMMDAGISFLWADAAGNEVLLDSDGSLPSSPVAGLRPVRFLDGWGVVSATSDRDYVGLCRAFGIEDAVAGRLTSMTERLRNRKAANEVVDLWHALAANMTMADAEERLHAENVPHAWVLAPSEVVADRHAVEIGLFEHLRDPVVGPVRMPRHPIRFQATPVGPLRRAPGLGEHTDEILSELGLDQQIDYLRARSIVA